MSKLRNHVRKSLLIYFVFAEINLLTIYNSHETRIKIYNLQILSTWQVVLHHGQGGVEHLEDADHAVLGLHRPLGRRQHLLLRHGARLAVAEVTQLQLLTLASLPDLISRIMLVCIAFRKIILLSLLPSTLYHCSAHSH